MTRVLYTQMLVQDITLPDNFHSEHRTYERQEMVFPAFDDIPSGAVLIAFDTGKPKVVVGIATAVPREEAWYIKDVDVSPEYRRRGICAKLVQELIHRTHYNAAKPSMAGCKCYVGAFLQQKLEVTVDGKTIREITQCPLDSDKIEGKFVPT